MEFHPYSNFLPLIAGAAFDALVEDIRENGLLHPITLVDGKIIDGRNRYKACLVAGVEPRYETCDGCDPMAIVISNETRRHTTTDQKAIVAAHVWREVFEPAARAAGDLARRRPKAERLASADPNTSGRIAAAEKAARTFQVNHEKVRLADKVLKDSKTLASYNAEAGTIWEQVRDGVMSLQNAQEALIAWAEAYEIDTEFTKAGERAVERRQKAVAEEKARAKARADAERELVERAAKQQAEATARAERQAKEAAERVVRAAERAADKVERDRLQTEAKEAEKLARQKLEAEQAKIRAEQEEAQKELRLKQQAEDNARRAATEERRLREANFNKTAHHLHVAGTNLYQVLSIMEEAVFTHEQASKLVDSCEGIYEVITKITEAMSNEYQ